MEKTISASTNQYETPGTWGFLYDSSGRFYEETTHGGSVFWRGDVYASGRHLATYFEGNIYLDHQDQVGTDRSRNNTGQVNYTTTSLPFGDWLTQSPSPTAIETPVNFTGQRRDPESGLDDFTARYYTSTMGRFMSPDPGNAGATDEDPQTWNAYSYARNNPLNLTDPDGLSVRICDTTNHCTDISDADFKNYFSDAKNVKLDRDKIFIKDKNGVFQLAGTDQRVSFDGPQGIESANGMNMFMFSPFAGLVMRGLLAAEGTAGSAVEQGAADAASGASTGATSAAANQAAASGSQQAVRLTVHAAARAAEKVYLRAR